MIDAFIQSPNAPRPNGHYSQAVSAGGFLFVSAQLPRDNFSSSGLSLSEIVEEQTQSVMEGLLAIVQAAEGDVSSICHVRFYVTDLEHWSAVNERYAKFMGAHKPARSVLNVVRIKNDFLVMADAVCHI